MSRTLLVDPGSPVLRHASTRVLNQYPNHSALVETDAPAPEQDGARAAVGEAPAMLGLRLGAGAVVPPALQSLSAAPVAEDAPLADDAPLSAYVEFIGPIDGRWLEQLRKLAIRVLAYQPESSYLCYGSRAAFQAAQAQVLTTAGTPAIRAVTPLTPVLKQQLPLVSEDGSQVVIVVAAAPEQREEVLGQVGAVPGVELIEGAGNDVLDGNRMRLRARIGDGGVQASLLQLPQVLSVEAWQAPRPEDEVAGLIIAGLVDAGNRPAGSYRTWLEDHGIDGAGVTIGIVDGGVDDAHPAFGGRVRDLAEGQKDWHATMVAGHAAGNYLDERDGDQFIYGLGTAPGAALLSQDKMQAAGFVCRQTVSEAGAVGAIQNNSWGKETRNPMDYGSDEALYDALVRNADPQGAQPLPLTICFSSGNSGELGLTRPKAAKNLIVTGNSENFRPDVGHDGSDNINQVYSGAHGSSYGNCGDGRIRPHVVAPGEWTASANYDCHPGEDEYISAQLTWGGGSSGASPKTAGACALLTDWWRRNNDGATPSPAMLRALVVNGAEPIETGGSVPNRRQGWGRLNVQNILDPAVARILVDQDGLLAQPGETRAWQVRAADGARPLKITLAWTDPPGAVGSGGSPDASCIVNRLALRAEIGGRLYRGVHDRFRNGISIDEDEAAQGTGTLLPEGSDNLQNIFLPAEAVDGPVRVTVTALNLSANCLDGGFDPPQQDFALVIANGQLDGAGTPSDIVVTVDARAGSPAPANGAKAYWSDGHSDAELIGDAGGSDTHASNNGNGIPNPPASSQADDAWWADDNQSKPETGRRGSARAAGDAQFAQAMNAGCSAGFTLLGTAGHLPQLMQLAVARETPSKRMATPLSEAIARLLARSRTDARPLCALLALGAGTRVSVDDVRALRALALRARLFLLADDPGVIAFLAQRIGHPAAVRYRLARERTELPDLMLDTLAEAGGLQPVAIAAAGAGYRFDVVAEDRDIVVHIRFSGPAAGVRLVRPGAPDVNWRPDDPAPPAAEGVAVGIHDGVLQLHAAAQTRPGTWTVEIGEPGAAIRASAAVRAWALGGPAIGIATATVKQGGGAAVEAARAGEVKSEGRLVQLSGLAGAKLLRATIPPPRIAAPGSETVAEAARDLVLQVRRSRLDSGASRVAEDDRRPLPVPVLGQVLQVPGPALAASVLDLPIDVLGVDAAGKHFARRIRTNLVRMQAQSAWRAQAAAAAPRPFYTRGQIAEMTLKNGMVVLLRLTRGQASRTVKVVSPVLGRQLAGLDADDIRGHTFIFGVLGGELLTVFSPFSHGLNVAVSRHEEIAEGGAISREAVLDWDYLMSMLMSGTSLPRPRGGIT